MRVDLQRRLDLRVSEALRNHVHGHAGFQRERRACVPQSMERNGAHLRGLDEAREFPLPEVVRLERQAERILALV